ncbi:hypothetical protein ACFL2O_00180 [Thermodesulfobacteriota bacterium]
MFFDFGGISFSSGEDTSCHEGELIAKHIARLEKYGDGKPFLEDPSCIFCEKEVMTWRIGDGVLIIEFTFSAGIITDLSYVIIRERNKIRNPLKVKEFNPATGEMTIIVPNKQDSSDGK